MTTEKKTSLTFLNFSVTLYNFVSFLQGVYSNRNAVEIYAFKENLTIFILCLYDNLYF